MKFNFFCEFSACLRGLIMKLKKKLRETSYKEHFVIKTSSPQYAMSDEVSMHDEISYTEIASEKKVLTRISQIKNFCISVDGIGISLI